jgi:hypothetical protein
MGEKEVSEYEYVSVTTWNQEIDGVFDSGVVYELLTP